MAAEPEYAQLHARFMRLQAETQRLAAAYALAAEQLEDLHTDKAILTDKLVRIRVRRRNLVRAADADLGALMTAKTLFVRHTRRAMRRQFPLASRNKISRALDDAWDALPADAQEEWQRDLKTYAEKPVAPPTAPPTKPVVAKAVKKEEKVDGPLVAAKKAPSKSRAKPKPAAAPIATDESKPKPAPRKRPPPKKKDPSAAPEPKKPRKSPQVKAPRKPTANATPKKTPTKKAKKADAPPPPTVRPLDLDDGSSGGSSVAPSDEDDSDDNMMHLPMGAFG
ncbi:hypothetical protein SDRG_13585 [Saprolegnia diclina VS20]|uniref:Uncharacterized protein n=1 Tax=Saprolegnia diclina (strain VS20) TaxID=1156394 RepID=T0RG90_SAPDV|nr:hypothetical protein SDRG_13585 [Saprolegnia diclina VS20]EQC28712.1 hypothetical protein SDRG_13585 [Saprolegnia diclina VS20]|eukprot:XP_008617904.1 hypothetical protein SDRG_13585 [Saprolegnia diclina VS20]